MKVQDALHLLLQLNSVQKINVKWKTLKMVEFGATEPLYQKRNFWCKREEECKPDDNRNCGANSISDDKAIKEISKGISDTRRSIKRRVLMKRLRRIL